MKSYLFAACTLVSLWGTSTLRAQDPTAPGRIEPAVATTKTDAAEATTMSLGELKPTPEMWFYEQERRRLEDPKAAIRRRAEFETAQRQARIAARQWYGYSNLRPVASPTPFTDSYSPAWVANTYYPYRWVSPSRPWVIYRSPESGASFSGQR